MRASRRYSPKRCPLSRSDEVSEEIHKQFLESQRSEKDVLTDVHLVCKDGIIPAHAIILQASSSLFAEVLKSQGDNYLTTRTILLPDYYLYEMSKVIEVIYSGVALLSDSDDAKDVEEILTEFGVDNIKATKGKGQKEVGGTNVRCYAAKRITSEHASKDIRSNHQKTQQTNLDNLKPIFGNQIENRKRKNTEKRNLRSRNKKTKKNTSDESSDSDSGSEYEPESKTRRSKRSLNLGDGSPQIVLKRAVQSQSPDEAKDANTVSTIQKKNNSTSKHPPNNRNDDEPPSDDWEEPDYNNKVWFETEAKKCQKCNKQHTTAALASSCITSHQRLRCYFCFAIAKNTEKLFEHFTKKHKQASRENCLVCPYCENTVPFKSVSCHVISVHLSDVKNQAKQKTSSGPGRPPNCAVNQNKTPTPAVTASTSNAISAQSSKSKEGNNSSEAKKRLPDDDGMFRVGNLDITIRNKMGNGKIRVYELHKDRSV